MLPTKAKIAAFVCSGRRRLKVSHLSPKFACQNESWLAMSTPTRKATAPQTMVAMENARTMSSS